MRMVRACVRACVRVCVCFVCSRFIACLEGDINKSDLEKLVKDKEATELKAAETRRVSEGEVVAICGRSVGRSVCLSVCLSVGRSVCLFTGWLVYRGRYFSRYAIRYTLRYTDGSFGMQVK